VARELGGAVKAVAVSVATQMIEHKTGGAGCDAAYNARTRELAAGKTTPRRRAPKVTFTAEELEYYRTHTARPR
jgi:hypothetical protein